MSALRQKKGGYAEAFGDIDTGHRLHDDPLVDPRQYGLDGTSYYAQPNIMTGEVLPVPDAPLLRLDVVLRLQKVNTFLRTDQGVRSALGVPAYLRIDDGLRPLPVQRFAFEIAWPAIIKRKNPELSPQEVIEQVRRYCAEPKSTTTATPHLTGGGFDVALINAETEEAFDRGHMAGGISGTAFPDFHEGYHLLPGVSDIANTPEQSPVAPANSEVVIGRRVLYHAMARFGFYINPHEIWHFGIGDPLSAYVRSQLSGHRVRPYYGIAELPDWYLAQMEALQA